MNRESNYRIKKDLPDLFDEALELEDAFEPEDFPEEELIEATVPEIADEVTTDPTFFDEQVINVPMIDPPDMKNISSYPDAQIYDHLFSLDDEDLMEETSTDDIVPVFPEFDPLPDPKTAPVPKKEAGPAISVKKAGKKPPVKRAGMPKTEEEPEEIPVPKEAAEPIRKKPRVKRAGETAAAASASEPAAAKKPVVAKKTKVAHAKAASAPAKVKSVPAKVTAVPSETTSEAPATSDGTPPIALMNVGSPRKTPPKKPTGKPGTQQKRSSSAKTGSAKPQRSKAAKPAEEVKPAPEEKPAKKKLPFSPLEKMKQKLAQKWS